MAERERIIRLVREGRITPEEAALLLDALAEIEAAPGAPLAHLDGLPGLRWLKVQLDSEDLEVHLDRRLQKPRVEGDVVVQEQAPDLVLSRGTGSRRRGSTQFLGLNLNWDFDFSTGRDPVVYLPEGWGLEVELASGDLEVSGLPFVRGRVTGGDAKLLEVHGVDLVVASGDLEAQLVLTQGEHRLEVTHGDAEICFRNSSVQVVGQLSSGDLEARGNFIQEKHKVSGTVGEGKARLRLKVVSGDLALEDEHVRA
ncbi:DUF4097 family beta strand repeat-containing protein [Meiothermus granaticius]|uniref:Putative adhesin n=1 Tax=Meiothermus granaticius NBRC 107808 TaxID=1227551 RepID=A0A399FBN0_9DEIN|nr:DUF4097 family beta strand repeat-containing protein [Meiothermus granaticius]RIH92332.1 putative adhesin [Meiothermus granaticius NBRC 107808]GEM87124.1 hypothetical protein MGR01S_17490 [Meiothermus granaticius NBRC 107808]